MKLIAIIFQALLIASCGMGTEVGNGLKPTSGPPDSKQPDTAEKAAPTAAQNTEAGAPEVKPTLEPGAATQSDSAAPTDLEPFDLNLLFTSCATPFSEAFANVTLKEVRTDKQIPVDIIATYDPVIKIWAVEASRDGMLEAKKELLADLLFAVKPATEAPDASVTSTNGMRIADVYTCTTVPEKRFLSASPADPIRETRVTLTNGHVSYDLSWSIKNPGQAKAEIINIEVQQRGIIMHQLIPKI